MLFNSPTTSAYPWSTVETDYGFQFTPFSCSRNVGCCAGATPITYEVCTNADGTGKLASNLYSFTDASNGQKVMNIVDRSTIDLTGTVYYIYASNKDTSPQSLFTSAAHVVSAPIRWKVECGPESVVAEEGTWPAGYTRQQSVPINDGSGITTEFKLPTYLLKEYSNTANSISLCPVISIHVTD